MSDTRFRFRLERVLDLRRRAEEAAARELANAEQQLREAEAARDRVVGEQDRIAAHREAEARRGGTHIGALRAAQRLAEDLEQHRQVAERRVEEQQVVVSAARAEVITAARAVQILERLREQKQEVFNEELHQRERGMMDEIARIRWRPTPVRPSAAATTGPATSGMVAPSIAAANAPTTPSPADTRTGDRPTRSPYDLPPDPTLSRSG